MTGERLKKILLPLAFWLGVWWLCALLVGKDLILPAPASVAVRLWSLLPDPGFWWAVGASIGRVLAGFCLGSLLGVGLGALTAVSPWGDALLSPALRAVRTVPVVSLILLLFFSLPTHQVPTVVSALMVLPVVWRATRQGIAAADPRLLELADHYRLGLWRKLRLVYCPAALSALASGWETALGLCWKSGVAAEVLCQPKWGAGSQLQAAKAYLDAPGLFAWTVVLILLSLGMEWFLRLFLRAWRGGGKV